MIFIITDEYALYTIIVVVTRGILCITSIMNLIMTTTDLQNL